MNPFRCQICGETYLGAKAPDRCPYCGAAGKNLVSPAQFIDHGAVSMSDESRKACRQALKLEMENAAFYKRCAAEAETQISQSAFKRLGKQESEHAEVIADMLAIDEGDLPETDIPASDAERFAEAHQHEQKAIEFYLQVAREASEERVREVFRALSDIELEHLKLSNIYG